MTQINVTRRYVKKDYFEERTGGYFGAAPAPSSSTGRHWECGRLTNLESPNVIYYFPTKFGVGVIPIGLKNLTAYRIVELTTGVWGVQDVLFTFASNIPVNEYGFGLVIHPTEVPTLSEVIIEFAFTE